MANNLNDMTFDSRDGNYYGYLSDGRLICVDGDEMAECQEDIEKAEYDAEAHRERELAGLLDPNTWAACIGLNEHVHLVPKDSPKYQGT